MSDRDKMELREEVNVVFHSAASIKFDDELSKAVTMNVRGTKELMDLAKGMGNLRSFVHVSTCYSHCHHLLCPSFVDANTLRTTWSVED